MSENWKARYKQLELVAGNLRVQLNRALAAETKVRRFLKEKVDPELSTLAIRNDAMVTLLEKIAPDCADPDIQEVLATPRTRTELIAASYQPLMTAVQKVVRTLARGEKPWKEEKTESGNKKTAEIWVVEQLTPPMARVEENRDRFQGMKPRDPGQEMMKRAVERDEQDPIFRKLMEEGGGE